MTSLYDQNPTVWNRLSEDGFPSLAAMSRRFVRASLMDTALGYDNATARWARGAGFPSGQSERKAKAWLAENDGHVSSAIPAHETVKPTTGTMLLVVCDNATADRAKKMLALIGCEVTEV